MADGVEPLVTQRREPGYRSRLEIAHRGTVEPISPERRCFRSERALLIRLELRRRHAVHQRGQHFDGLDGALEFDDRTDELIEPVADQETVDGCGRMGERPADDAHLYAFLRQDAPDRARP